MKRTLGTFLLALMLVLPVYADVTGTLTAATQEVGITVSTSDGAVSIQITGTWSGIVTFEGTVDGTNWVSIDAVPASSSTAVTTTTSNGVWRISASGLAKVRARMSSFTSGTA